MGRNLVIVVLLFAVVGVGYKIYTAGVFGEKNNQKIHTVVSAVKQRVPVVLYSSNTCRYCLMTKAFLKKKGIEYQVRDINIGKNSEEMTERTNGSRSIPQIFINRQHIGGYGALLNLEKSGELNKLLQGMEEDK